MKKIFMMVYSEIKKDARVMRAADALCQYYDVYIYACGEINKEKITSIPIKNCPSLDGYSTYIKFILGAISECCRIKPDIVYGHDIFSAIPMEVLRFIFGKKCKYIYDAHELFMFQDEQKYSLADRIQYYYEHLSIKKSDLVFCAEEKRAEIMVDYHKINKKPIVIRNISYLPNTADNEFKEKYKAFFEIPAFSIVYAGGLLFGRKLDLLIDAVNQAGFEYKLMLIGDGPAFKSLSEQIEKYQNPNIRVSSGLPYEKLKSALELFDVGYLYYNTTDLNNRYCAPNKIYEYAGIGLPILGNDNPTVKEIVHNNEIGICTDDIIEGILTLKRNQKVYKSNASRFVEQNTLEKEMNYLVEAVRSVSE